MSTYEVTFRIVRPVGTTPVVGALADVLREAAGLPHESPAWAALRGKLCAGEAVRVRLGANQFVRFFLGRRDAGTDAVHRLKWEDAVEVVQAEGVAA